ncbi:nuclear transport factor 2 family protein [Pseudidiomarina terrestris]|uniref:Nuclear transport factor 2 family protein n=1 Tax=Pseudidiomarina terrestris TaxID=2820060 RepID=A0AAW7R0P1_9GAMM|nr:MULTISPECIES: nuclear transport factor 2 family protein [unclassified Pseudidiomarina]MDN7124195.1 nuclear transport factor 2 family protein [Pseudidiomarina sp. 1APP75-32.1]MDN7127262.1 nuclear transport factor 2 family protein [Pseudidiomarina sp. 1APR75-33.1]MDN7128452.1 nuclear transport factor 2 family protein [Pseudidiomarina sp. 1APR75-15]MDN7135300.1 nuclear transport factor 2 family protein [Pseudidiomarina sp. 1ASP75-5]MEA3586930.1 nuclear transport factor 2 family protein [Pseudi
MADDKDEEPVNKAEELAKKEEYPEVIERLLKYYDEFSDVNIDKLDELYHEDVTFIDPIHQVHGLDDLKSYFKGTMEGVEQCHFAFTEYAENGAHVFVNWQMRLCHPKLGGGEEIVVPGVSHLEFKDDKIIQQRDYYDLGAMIYEHVSLLGYVIHKIKERMVP